MKKSLIVALLFSGLTAGMAQDYHDFIAQGKPVRAKILRFDTRKQEVTVQTDKKKTVKVPLSIFSEKDQEYVLQWEFNKIFLSESSFKIKAKRKETRDKDASYGSSFNAKKVENSGYEITLENKSTSKLENLDVEYCIYYEQERATRGKQVTEDGVRYGTLDVGYMTPKSKKELMTKSVAIYTTELNADYHWVDGRENKQTGKVRGVWVKVNMKLENGETLSRNYCLPDGLRNSKVWTTSSKNVGMNNSRK